jgi:pentatricopeptide repeat protein
LFTTCRFEVLTLFPCDDILDVDATYEILQAVKKLVEDSGHEAKDFSSEYMVTIGALESISMVTKRSNDLSLLVWDIAELLGYHPNECMFEDVIISFGGAKTDTALKAILDMENSGYAPEYALLRQCALKLSCSDRRLVFAKNVLAYNKDSQYRSTSTMNCLLLGYGMRKDLDSAFEVFELFQEYDLRADENTFAFLMESFWLCVKARFQSSECNDDDISDILGIVDTILGSMELAGVERDKRFIYEHMRLLCLIKQVDDAKQCLHAAISDKISVKASSIVMIANGYLAKGDVQSARDVANLFVAAGCGEAPAFLLDRIGSLPRDEA